MNQTNFKEVFPMKKPVIGMLHMAGDCGITQSLRELEIYQRAGVDAVIVENYHASTTVITNALGNIMRDCKDMIVGINILPNEYVEAFQLAKEFHLKFIQLDIIAGKYEKGGIDIDRFNTYRERYDPDGNIVILGGVWPKYYKPIEHSSLQSDVQEGKERADAIVVTGNATGNETPLKKIKTFREILGDFPLIVGAGLNTENVTDQLSIADGGIVGSAFKPYGETEKLVEFEKVEKFMDKVHALRQTV